MAKKMAFFDIDGTLTRPDGEISQAVIDAIKQAAQNDVKIVLASGRPTFGMLELAKIFNLDQSDGYIISYNGCGIYHVPSGKYLAQHFVQRDVLLRLDQELHKYPEISPIFYDNEQILTTKRNYYVDFEAELNNSVAFERDFYPEGSPKLIWAGEPTALDKIEPVMQEQFAKYCTIARSLPCFLEFTPRGIDKGAAIAEICRLLDHPLADTFAFGDGNNDRAMLEVAGVGIAMENGRDELKAIADFIAPSNKIDGVIVAIEKFLLD